MKIDIAERHPRNAKSHFYKVKGCSTCPFMPFCKKGMSDKESNERIFEINEEYYDNILLRMRGEDEKNAN